MARSEHMEKQRELMSEICNAQGIDRNKVVRLLIDMGVDAPMKIYVEMVGDPAVIKLDWAKIPADIHYARKEE